MFIHRQLTSTAETAELFHLAFFLVFVINKKNSVPPIGADESNYEYFMRITGLEHDSGFA